MSVPASHLARFIKRCHRRIILLRGLERAGRGIAVGALAAIVLVPILIYRGDPAFNIAIALPIVCAVIGIASLLLRRPTMFDAAIDADRQLGLADLLSSAMLVRQSKSAPRDSFAQTVIALAESRAQRTAPSQLVFAHLGARAWGGIAVSAALALALGIFPATAPNTRASDLAQANNHSRDNATLDRPAPISPYVVVLAPPDPAIMLHEHDDKEDHSPNSSPGDNNSSSATGQQNDTAPSHNTSQTPGLGSGESHSAEAHNPAHPLTADATHAGDHPATGNTPTGGTGQSTDQGAVGQATGHTATASNAQANTPPWQSDHWNADIQSAQQGLDSGQTPASYRDMIREYFTPERP